MQVARIYLRVSTDQQNLDRQEQIEAEAIRDGFYIANVYREKASGASADRPELQRMINDLREGEVVIAEKLDRLSRLPLNDAEQLIASIRSKGARLCIPGLIDLSQFAQEVDGIGKIVIQAMEELLLKIALQSARDDYETRRRRQQQGIAIAKSKGKYKGRKANSAVNDRIVQLRLSGEGIKNTARMVGCSESQVKKVWSKYKGKFVSK
ncbi:recombinase family protein [Kistimonas asteriae]|uniref:recombinase family protein n=1 Tax=Kistimonas asteriae TaxID=517724 RepID=UPI001BA7025B|nr:recombinase family protein [Kistimonas asteriae]